METLYTGAIHGFPQSNSGGPANGISSGIASSFDQDGVLSLIVVLGGSLSLVALVFAFITYSLFSDLRSLAGTTLMNLLAALFMVQLLFIVGVGGVQDLELCISLGLSLQYLRMTVVCWLAAMCHHLYATVASIPRRDDPPTYLKYSLFAWGAPFINLAVAVLLQIREANDIWNTTDLTPFNCWFLGTKATIYAYGLPVVLLFLAAFYYLIKAAIVSRYTCSMQLEIKQREKMKRRRALQMFLFLKVCVIVGLVTGCGVASRVWKVPFLWAVFCTGHSLQFTLTSFSSSCTIISRLKNRTGSGVVRRLQLPSTESVREEVVQAAEAADRALKQQHAVAGTCARPGLGASHADGPPTVQRAVGNSPTAVARITFFSPYLFFVHTYLPKRTRLPYVAYEKTSPYHTPHRNPLRT